MPRAIDIRRVAWPIRGRFAIARGSRTETPALIVELTQDGAIGRGECVPYPRYGETLDGVEAQIRGLADSVAGGLDRAALQRALPAGAARNAIDCALWDLEAKLTGQPVWRLAGLREPRPVETAYTLSLDTDENMAAAAADGGRPLLKLKLTGDGDLERVSAVRHAAPETRLIVDANEGWTPSHLKAFGPAFAKLGVEMIEQPLPAGEDAVLADTRCPVTLCADESCHDRASLDVLEGRYGMINIKLDKAGGLTEALALRDEARRRGFRIMVGCMLSSSLAMAPAVLVAQGVDIVDLDGPLLLARDWDPSLVYNGTTVQPPTPALWG
ncbi:MAG: N-acetyl-D-Glu racemase DgcA [Inquilinaceae bacterium]